MIGAGGPVIDGLPPLLRTELVPLRIAYRPAEAAEATGLSVETIKAVIARGELPVCKVGTASCILRQDLECFLLARRVRKGSTCADE